MKNCLRTTTSEQEKLFQSILDKGALPAALARGRGAGEEAEHLWRRRQALRILPDHDGHQHRRVPPSRLGAQQRGQGAAVAEVAAQGRHASAQALHDEGEVRRKNKWHYMTDLTVPTV